MDVDQPAISSENETVAKSDLNTKDSGVISSEFNGQDSKVFQEFKTPSFSITSKKKVQKTSSDIFKSPENTKSIISKNESPQANDTNDSVTDENDVCITNDSESKPPTENVCGIKDVDKKQTVSKLSPAEQLRNSKAGVPYKEPPWSALSENSYAFEVIKNGAVIDKVELKSKAYHIVGRLPSCDIPMEHPSLSRYHAVLQYSNGSSESFPKGWYLYDLDSTHGTWINKHKVPQKKYHRLHVDYVVKYGGSTRLFILQGPDFDREEESELSVKEMKEQREKLDKEAELLRQAEIAEEEKNAEIIRKREEDKGCSWGIDDDAGVEDENEENPFALLATENEDLYIDDPKKSLNGYFEREGYDPPQYEFSEAGFGKRKCTVELPIDGPNGEPIVAEVVLSGKKKDAVIQCALEACRIIDRHGLLRKSTHESRKKKDRNWEEDDYYDSDEDIYLDRTGTIEKKRQIRMTKVGKSSKSTETYETLLQKHKEIMKEIQETENKLEEAKAEAAAFENEEVDALDAYMTAIKSGAMDTKTKMKLKCRLLELKQEEQKTRKLVNIAKPASLPELKVPEQKTAAMKAGLLAGVGKIKGLQHKTLSKAKVVPSDKLVKEQEDGFVEEEEEEDEVGDSQGVSCVTKSEETTNEAFSGVEPKVTSTKTSKSAYLNEKTKQVLKHDSYEKKKATNNKAAVIKGPALPLSAVLEQLQDESESLGVDDNDVNSKRKPKDSHAQKKKAKIAEYDNTDLDYATWVPPQNQAGDGKTHLNAKYGY